MKKHDIFGYVLIGISFLFLFVTLYGQRRRQHLSNQMNAWSSLQKEVEKELSQYLDFDVNVFRKNTENQKKFFMLIDGTAYSDKKLKEIQKSGQEASKLIEKQERFFLTDKVKGSTFDITDLHIIQFKDLFSNIIRQIGGEASLTSPSESEDPTDKDNYYKYLKPYFKGKFDLDKPYDTRMALFEAKYTCLLANLKKGTTAHYESRKPTKEELSTDKGKEQNIRVKKEGFLSSIVDQHAIAGGKGVLKNLAKAYMSSIYFGLVGTDARAKDPKGNVRKLFGG